MVSFYPQAVHAMRAPALGFGEKKNHAVKTEQLWVRAWLSQLANHRQEVVSAAERKTGLIIHDVAVVEPEAVKGKIDPAVAGATVQQLAAVLEALVTKRHPHLPRGMHLVIGQGMSFCKRWRLLGTEDRLPKESGLNFPEITVQDFVNRVVPKGEKAWVVAPWHKLDPLDKLDRFSKLQGEEVISQSKKTG